MRSPAPPVPTLGELHAHVPWLWLNCTDIVCNHSIPVALAPFVIRWGPDASSDVLRRSAVCRRCGRQGATTSLPSFINTQVGVAPFPVDRMSP